MSYQTVLIYVFEHNECCLSQQKKSHTDKENMKQNQQNYPTGLMRLEIKT